jgi:ribosomal protein S18 acetylase RimI-like enzyme
MRPRSARPVAGLDPGTGRLAVVAGTEITFALLDGRQAAEHASDLEGLHAEVYRDPPYPMRPLAEFARQLRVRSRQPGYVLAEARHGGYLVGYAAGMPLRPSTSWWRDVTTPLAEAITTEYQGRTFALLELAVRAAWRRQGIGRVLHDMVLRNRSEERATLVVRPAATAAQAAFQDWGWRKVARTNDPDLESGVADVLVSDLPLTGAP